MKRKLFLAFVTPLMLAACSESPEAKAKREAAALQALKAQMRLVAQDALDKDLIGTQACVKLGGEGRLWSIQDADLVPDTSMWRFMEREGIAVRQIVERTNGERDVRFFVRELYRENYYNDRFCFGRWAIVDITPTPKGKADKRYGVMMYPFNITMRLTQIKSQAWLDSRLIRENLIGLDSITKDRTIRAYLPKTVEELPPPGIKKKLDQ